MRPSAAQTKPDDRFEFGENWKRFAATLDPDRIAEAERSLAEALGADAIAGAAVVDVGSGSGLFSLAAMRLGAARVHSFDFDSASVATTASVKADHFPASDQWTVEAGDILDHGYLGRLGSFDVVYAWGVLHHTGDMWSALANVERLVAPGGRLMVSIYNDQGVRSRLWRVVKRTYNALPKPLRLPYTIAVMGPREVAAALVVTVRSGPLAYLRAWTKYKHTRGMSRWHDIVDWVGGYPFEVATPENVFEFYRRRGYVLERLQTRGGGLGCNEFVFRKPA